MLALTSRSGASTPFSPTFFRAFAASPASRPASPADPTSAALSNGGRFGNAEKSPPSCGAMMNGGVCVRASDVPFAIAAASVEIWSGLS